MLRGLIVGAGTALALSALLITAVSLIVPPTGEFPVSRSESPVSDAPAQPRMAGAEETAPSRPEALPAPREAPPPVVAVETAPEEAAPAPAPGPAAAPREETAATSLAVPAGSQFNRPREDFQPVAPGAEEVPRGVAAGPSSRPAVEGPVAAPAPDTSTAGAPAPGIVVAGVAPPVAGEAPVVPAPEDGGAPRTFREVPIEDPVAPPQDPETETTEAAPQPEPGPAVEESGIAPIGAPAADTEAPVLGAASREARPEVVASAPSPAAPPEGPIGTGARAQGGAPLVQESIAAPAPATEIAGFGRATGRTVTLVEVPVELGSTGGAPEAPAAEAAPERSAPRRIVLDSDRAESLGSDPAPAPAEAAPGLAPALVANAAPFENEEGRPLFSIVLIDDPSGGMSRSSLLDFSFPVTFAIDPTRPDAAEAAAAYRAAGHEVLLLADGLAPGGDARDVAVALAGALAELPGVVGVLDRQSDGFARDRAALAALLPGLSEEGLGLVAYDGGLNAGLAAAERAGVPAETIYRVVDAAGERSTVIARFLDRATFEAAQQGQAIVVGRTRPDTVTALLSWALGRRSDTVAVAPVSHLLRDGVEG